MIEIIEGNLFDTDAKFICHQVNCMGKMGSGVALQVRQRFPHVYEEYKKVASSDMLGKVQIVPVKPNILDTTVDRLRFQVMNSGFVISLHKIIMDMTENNILLWKH